MEETKVVHKKKVLAPKFRFKEFNQEWEKKTLFDVSENVAYGMNAAATDFDGKHKYIRITDIDIVTGEFKPDPLTSPLGDIDEKFRLKVGDVVFARTGASVGKSYLYNTKDGELYYAGFLIKFSITKANPYFIYTLTLKEAYNKWIHIYSMRSGQPGLNAEEYKALKFNIPSLPEQQKIAGFLSAVDEKIQLLYSKKQLLEQYKKGVMQQLFSGKLRFKDANGKAFPKWEQKLLGNLIEIGSSKRVLQEDWKDEGVPFLRTREIINLSNGDDFRTPIFISEDLFSELKTKYGVPKSGDILATGVGTIGELYIVKKSDKFYFKDGNVIWFKMNDKLDSNYLSQLFKTKYIKKQLIDNASITTVATFTIDGAKKTRIIYPCLEEQKKIADFLAAIDVKIESLSNQISQTQNFKKGLLQQMFV